MRSRASAENFTSLAAISIRSVEFFAFRRSGDHAHDVGFLHDQELLAVELDLGAGPLAEQHAVAGLDVEADELAGLVAAARADGDDLALLGLLLGGVRNDDSALGLFLALETTDDDAVVQRTKLCFGHGFPRRRIVAPALLIGRFGRLVALPCR